MAMGPKSSPLREFESPRLTQYASDINALLDTKCSDELKCQAGGQKHKTNRLSSPLLSRDPFEFACNLLQRN